MVHKKDHRHKKVVRFGFEPPFLVGFSYFDQTWKLSILYRNFSIIQEKLQILQKTSQVIEMKNIIMYLTKLELHPLIMNGPKS